MWKHAGRCFDKSQQRVLLISAEILYLLTSHEPIGCRRIQVGFPETCLPAVLAATAAAPAPGPVLRASAGQGVGWPRAAAETASLKPEIRAALASGPLPTDQQMSQEG